MLDKLIFVVFVTSRKPTSEALRRMQRQDLEIFGLMNVCQTAAEGKGFLPKKVGNPVNNLVFVKWPLSSTGGVTGKN